MEITIKVNLDGGNLDTAACSANAARLGVAITQLRTLQIVDHRLDAALRKAWGK